MTRGSGFIRRWCAASGPCPACARSPWRILLRWIWPPTGKEPMRVSLNFVSTQYFETVKIPLVGGRDFTDRDDSRSPGVVIIDETMARRFWAGENPIGKHFRLARSLRANLVDFPVEVIGVARNSKHRTLGEEQESHLYLPYLQ